MRAIVQVNYRDMRGNEYQVREVVSNRVTLEYNLSGQTILVDFNVDEVQVVLNHISLFRNQGERDARFVSYTHKRGYVFEYAMPSGKRYRNLIRNPFNTSDYKSIKN
jgi:hypothetical protein